MCSYLFHPKLLPVTPEYILNRYTGFVVYISEGHITVFGLIKHGEKNN